MSSTERLMRGLNVRPRTDPRRFILLLEDRECLSTTRAATGATFACTLATKQADSSVSSALLNIGSRMRVDVDTNMVIATICHMR